jgi:hypothetical protein
MLLFGYSYHFIPGKNKQNGPSHIQFPSTAGVA